MTSPLATARATMETQIEAVTPPVDPVTPYRAIEGRKILAGASGHRMFRFEPPSAPIVSEFGAALAVYEHQFEIRMRYRCDDLTFDQRFERPLNEAVLIASALNDFSGWPAGVRLVRCDGYRTEETESADVEIVWPMLAETEET